MKKIRVNLGERGYDVLIASDLLKKAGNHLKEHGFSGRLVIITNPKIQALYGSLLVERLSNNSFEVFTLIVADGEGEKSLDVAGHLYTELSDCHVERKTPILALGGGVVGDLAGFVAATYKRGVPLVQIPTTLLAQVDSSIGGKVAVNHDKLKNEIGVFYQPELVLSDITVLRTLPSDEFTNGMAEVIKSAFIKDDQFFVFIENNLTKIKALDEGTLKEIVFRTANIKTNIVIQDELDTGLRNILNYGHTIGHAIETTSDFDVKHGHAVAIGMIVAATIAEKLGVFDIHDLFRLKSLLEYLGLPTKMSHLDTGKIIHVMKHDKKISGGKVKFVLPKKIGEVFITDEVDFAIVEEVLRS
ncbi:MAG: 3-dehydroquinate synthase [Dehalococcoidia bacterium]|nr:MAG: 3-dehydroquinate synthase [Dehalococcoidia bacterium]